MAARPATPAPTMATSHSFETISPTSLQVYCSQGCRELLGQMVAIFCAESPGMLSAIRKSLDAGDTKELARAAHALKGSVGNFGKSQSFNVAEALEMNGLSGALGDSDAQLLALEDLISTLERDLTAFCR